MVMAFFGFIGKHNKCDPAKYKNDQLSKELTKASTANNDAADRLASTIGALLDTSQELRARNYWINGPASSKT